MSTRTYNELDLAYVKRVLDAGQDGRGEAIVEELEERFAAKVGARYAIAVNAGMSGLHIALAAAGVGPGVEAVVDPIVQFGGLAVMYNNGVPIFADVDPATHNMSPASLEERICERTKAVVVTHLWGLPAEMQDIRAIADRHGLVVVEDCAHALFAEHRGRKVGTWGHIGMFSFQAAKHLSTGQGGIVVTDDEALAKEMRAVAAFGAAPDRLAWVFRMAGVVAAVALAQLERAEGYVAEDRENAKLYQEAVAGCPWLVPQAEPPYSTHSHHCWAAAFYGESYGVDYEAFKRACREEGAQVSFGYTQRSWKEAQIVAAYEFPVFAEPVAYGKGCPTRCPLYGRELPYRKGYCPNAEALIPRLCVTALSTRRRDEVVSGALGLSRAIKRMGW
jgi:perosamine synthetase